jgi:sulfonate transport system ATP-binding protein
MAPHTGSLNQDFAVRVRNLTRRVSQRTVLAGLNLDIRQGEFIALLGKSGSGKSTFLKAIAGLDYDVSGSGSIYKPDRLSVVFQDARLLPWQSVLQNVTLGLTVARGQDAGRKALAEVGLAGRENAWPIELSGGEQQRVALARSLVREPALLFADEPFGALDALTRIKMHDLLRELCARHLPGVLLITHDVDEAITLADRVLVLHEGHLVEDVVVDLPAPREHGAPGFAKLRKHLLGRLGIGADNAQAA